MQSFSAWQYLLIDLANHYGLDAEDFDVRLQWANQHLVDLERFTDEADKPALYHKAVLAVRKAQSGEPTGHLVGFDAICSGLQVMSALTGCHAGAKATGLIDSGKRPDAYRTVTDTMNDLLKAEGLSTDVPRSDAKSSVMTSFYGSRATPKEIFGEDTPELGAFYQAIQQVAPGAWELLQELLGSWQPFTPMHRWVLPDGFVARVKVMEKIEKRIEVDELDHATFTYEWYENQGTESGLSNVANVVHSVDAYLLRCLIRRCSYDPQMARYAMECCFMELIQRDTVDASQMPIGEAPEAIQKYVERFEATNMVDVVIMDHLDEEAVCYLSDDHLRRLNQIMERMLDHRPFAIVSVHDEFKCHANHMNRLREAYVEIFAELADSTILSDIFSTLTGFSGHYDKLSHDLSQHIPSSNYAIC